MHMPLIDRLLLLLLFAGLAAPAYTQLRTGDGTLDPRFQEDQRIETDTPLGRLSVGVSGIREDVRNQATRGDVEVGTFYHHEFDAVFPRVLELRPFVFNRVDSTEEETFASLGIGVGTRVSLRKKHEENNWFTRISLLTPTELYRERYGSDREDQSILELFAGFEFTLNDVFRGPVMRERLSPPDQINLRVPARLFDTSQEIDPTTLKQIHALIIEAYLSAVLRQVGQGPMPDIELEPYWRIIHQIEHTTGQRLNLAQRHLLLDDRATEPEDRAAVRREIVSGFIRRGLTQIMREPYPLLIVATSPQPADPQAHPQQSVGQAMMSLPGVKLKPGNHPLDADAMIEDYIQMVTAAIQ